MLKTLLTPALRWVLTSDAFRDALRDAIASAISTSPLVEQLTDSLNAKLKLVSGRFDDLGLKGKLLKRYVVELLKDMAEEDATVRRAVEAGKPYFEAVLDGIDPEEIAHGTAPVVDLVRFKAQQVAQRFTQEG